MVFVYKEMIAMCHLVRKTFQFSNFSIQPSNRRISGLIYCLGRRAQQSLMSFLNKLYPLQRSPQNAPNSTKFKTTCRIASSKLNATYSYVASIPGSVVFVPSSTCHVFSIVLSCFKFKQVPC